MNSDTSGEDKVQMEVEEEIENISGDENGEMTESQRKRKRYHRHSSKQIQAMERFFRNCPHPDKKQRNELSLELGMEPLQVKFWFQNKRTQMKSKHLHQENERLMAENEKLRALNARYREALTNARCPVCGRIASVGNELLEEQRLRLENARLREEVARISAIATNYVGRLFNNSPSTGLGSGPFFKGSTSKAEKGSSEDEDY